ncbi:MAG: UbiH/UbiF/VisC/COQ6 family ubiquinone biosynthesis hydroxylase [Granulosicoccaceae bacterium]
MNITTTPNSVDIIIAGGGMVGSMLAAALAQLDTDDDSAIAPSVCLVDAQVPSSFDPGSNPAYDLRVSALNHASQNMLRNVGAWPHITARRCCPFISMCVWNQKQDARTLFNAADIGEQQMGHIVENRVIQLALHDQIRRSGNVVIECPDSLQKLRIDSNQVVATLESGKAITARLVVGADGANSLVRKQANIPITRDTYDQHALVATVQLAASQLATVAGQSRGSAHGNMTWQRFVPSGAQALLPLADDRASIVWYHSAVEVARLAGLSEFEFIQELSDTFPAELGKVESILQRGSFPLAKAHAEQYVKNRIALVGDAAHTVHPLAGQGVNLGLLDAAVLFDVIVECMEKQQDYADIRHLRKYQRARRGENSVMITILDGFYRAFTNQPKPVATLRDSTMQLVDNQQLLKQAVMRYATGSGGSLPKLAMP